MKQQEQETPDSMKKLDYNRTPVSIIRTGRFQKIHESHIPVYLEPTVMKLAAIVAAEFQMNREKQIINPEGKIPGFDGKYLSANAAFLESARQEIIASEAAGNRSIFIDSMLPEITTAAIVNVSDNLASEHYHMKENGNHHNNLISAMGVYFVPIIFDGKTPLLMFDVRPDDAFLDPGRLNSVSKALAVDASLHDYVAVALDDLEKKYGISMHPSQLKPVGTLFDNVHNIALQLGFAKIPYAQAEEYNRKIIKSGNIVPVKDMKKFLDENPLEKWTYTGLAAAYAAVRYGLDSWKYSDILYAFEKQFSRTKEHPLRETSSLELLGIDYLD